MSVDNFAILAFVGPIGIVTTPSGMEISLGAKCMGVFVGLPVDRVWNGGSDLQAGVEIYYWEHPRILAHFEQPKMTLFWDPNFTPRVVNWRPHISMPTGSPGLIRSCTLRYKSQVLSPIL